LGRALPAPAPARSSPPARPPAPWAVTSFKKVLISISYTCPASIAMGSITAMIVCIFGHIQCRWALSDFNAHGYARLRLPPLRRGRRRLSFNPPDHQLGRLHRPARAQVKSAPTRTAHPIKIGVSQSSSQKSSPRLGRRLHSITRSLHSIESRVAAVAGFSAQSCGWRSPHDMEQAGDYTKCPCKRACSMSQAVAAGGRAHQRLLPASAGAARTIPAGRPRVCALGFLPSPGRVCH
jgi:hypothetical protein